MSNAGTLSYSGHERLHAERQRRILTFAVVGSIALHGAAMAILPGLGPLHEPVRRVLDVILVQQPPVPEPIIQEPPRPQQIAPAREMPKPVKRAVREEPSRAPPLEKEPLLALPDPAPTAPSAFTVPPAVAEPQPAPAEPKPSVGAAPTAPTVRESVPAMPASFSAAYLRNAPPRYPLIARRNGVEGTVRLKVLVTRDGRAAQLELERSSGSSALDNAALEAVKNWQFIPARRGQEPVESWVLVPVVFRLEGAS